MIKIQFIKYPEIDIIEREYDDFRFIVNGDNKDILIAKDLRVVGIIKGENESEKN